MAMSLKSGIGLLKSLFDFVAAMSAEFFQGLARRRIHGSYRHNVLESLLNLRLVLQSQSLRYQNSIKEIEAPLREQGQNRSRNRSF